MEQEMPDYETIRAAVAGEKWALEKVLACYGDEINRLAMVKKRQRTELHCFYVLRLPHT